jgi:hypothetical protein
MQPLRKALGNGLLGIATTELNGNCQAYGLMPGHAYGVLATIQRSALSN